MSPFRHPLKTCLHIPNPLDSCRSCGGRWVGCKLRRRSWSGNWTHKQITHTSRWVNWVWSKHTRTYPYTVSRSLADMNCHSQPEYPCKWLCLCRWRRSSVRWRAQRACFRICRNLSANRRMPCRAGWLVIHKWLFLCVCFPFNTIWRLFLFVYPGRVVLVPEKDV